MDMWSPAGGVCWALVLWLCMYGPLPAWLSPCMVHLSLVSGLPWSLGLAWSAVCSWSPMCLYGLLCLLCLLLVSLLCLHVRRWSPGLTCMAMCMPVWSPMVLHAFLVSCASVVLYMSLHGLVYVSLVTYALSLSFYMVFYALALYGILCTLTFGCAMWLDPYFINGMR